MQLFFAAIVSLLVPVPSYLLTPQSRQETLPRGTRGSLISTAPPKFEYLGCFVDDGDRAFKGGWSPVGLDAHAVDKCKEICRHHCYMAIQYGQECFCDSNPAIASGPYQPTVVTECRGGSQPNEYCSVPNGCGAQWRNSVYANSDLWSSTCSRKEPGPLSQVRWKLCNADNTGPTAYHSNLAGKGPDKGPEEFRIKQLVKARGVVLDLVVTVAPGETYISHLQNKKQQSLGSYVSPCPTGRCTSRHAEPQTPPCYAVITIHVNTYTKFNFKFVTAGTNDVVIVDKFGMKFHEIDRERDDWDGQGPDNEHIDFVTTAAELNHGNRVKKYQTVGKEAKGPWYQSGGPWGQGPWDRGIWRIESIEQGVVEDNPQVSGPPLKDFQEQRSADAVYLNRGEWEIGIGHYGSKSRFDRHFVFSGYVIAPED